MLNEQVVADNLALIERNRELECELAALKARLGAVSRLADKCESCARRISDAVGDLASGTDLGRMHVYFSVAHEIREAVG